MVLSLGKKQIVKCLLHIQRQFNNCEPYHVLNMLYITDYCVWVQTLSEKTFTSLSQYVSNVRLSKADLRLNLLEVERSHTVDSCSNDSSLYDISSSSDDCSDSDSNETAGKAKSMSGDDEEKHMLCHGLNRAGVNLDGNDEQLKEIIQLEGNLSKMKM